MRSKLLRPLDRRYERLYRQVQMAQEMAGRAYEATQRWPEQLEELRAAPGYDLAYEEPEPLVTVRIGTYNRAELLCERALASVRAQTYENWEAVVVGDHCTDNTEERIRAIGDGRIRFTNLPFNGPYPKHPLDHWRVAGCNARNAATRAARGRWIAPLDDDDEFAADHIEVLLAEARGSHAEIAYGQLRAVDAHTHKPLGVDICRWPPERDAFNLLASLMHSGLKRFDSDRNSYLAGEVDDWNLTRRLWEAGVRFSFVDRVVATYYFRPRTWP